MGVDGFGGNIVRHAMEQVQGGLGLSAGDSIGTWQVCHNLSGFARWYALLHPVKFHDLKYHLIRSEMLEVRLAAGQPLVGSTHTQRAGEVSIFCVLGVVQEASAPRNGRGFVVIMVLVWVMACCGPLGSRCCDGIQSFLRHNCPHGRDQLCHHHCWHVCVRCDGLAVGWRARS